MSAGKGSRHPFLDALVRFRATWPQRGWSYDNRFECVASSFSTDFAEARALLAPLLPQAYDERALRSAPPAVVAIASRTGGIRAAQLVLVGVEQQGLIPYGLWWPWDEGGTISIRLGLDGPTSASYQEDLCAIFNAQ